MMKKRTMKWKKREGERKKETLVHKFYSDEK